MNDDFPKLYGYWNDRNRNPMDSACLGKRGFKNQSDRWNNSGLVRSKQRNKNARIRY